MPTREELEKSEWWEYVGEDLQELLGESLSLYSWASHSGEKFQDYSFVVFPAAKAYEGVLKKILLDLKLISREDYFGKYFRIGKSLNPSLEKRFRNHSWVFDRLKGYCGDEELPMKLWVTWRESRNKIFHWFPDEVNVVSLSEAGERIEMIIQAIGEFFTDCRVGLKNEK